MNSRRQRHSSRVFHRASSIPPVRLPPHSRRSLSNLDVSSWDTHLPIPVNVSATLRATQPNLINVELLPSLHTAGRKAIPGSVFPESWKRGSSVRVLRIEPGTSASLDSQLSLAEGILHVRSRYIDTLTIGFYNLQQKGKVENPHTTFDGQETYRLLEDLQVPLPLMWLRLGYVNLDWASGPWMKSLDFSVVVELKIRSYIGEAWV